MTIDLNTTIGELKAQPSFDLSSVKSFLNNVLEAHKVRGMSFVEQNRLHAEIAQVNITAKKKVEEGKAILFLVKNSNPQPYTADLNPLISYYNDEIERFSMMNALLDDFFEQEGAAMYSDLKTTNSLILNYLEVAYDTIRYFKKINKKTSITTSQLANDTAAYSFSTLTTILNCH